LDTPSYIVLWGLDSGYIRDLVFGGHGPISCQKWSKSEDDKNMIKVFLNYLCPVARRVLISFNIPTACSMVVLFSCFYPFLFQ
jgi:hypothetical protein